MDLMFRNRVSTVLNGTGVCGGVVSLNERQYIESNYTTCVVRLSVSFLSSTRIQNTESLKAILVSVVWTNKSGIATTSSKLSEAVVSSNTQAASAGEPAAIDGRGNKARMMSASNGTHLSENPFLTKCV